MKLDSSRQMGGSKQGGIEIVEFGKKTYYDILKR
jgi:hypothetical protein